MLKSLLAFSCICTFEVTKIPFGFQIQNLNTIQNLTINRLNLPFLNSSDKIFCRSIELWFSCEKAGRDKCNMDKSDIICNRPYLHSHYSSSSGENPFSPRLTKIQITREIPGQAGTSAILIKIKISPLVTDHPKIS